MQTMEHQKTLNLLDEASDFKFATKKWNLAYDQSNANYDAGNEIIFYTEVLNSNLFDFNNVYISVKNYITITRNIAARVAFKCITQIDKNNNR